MLSLIVLFFVSSTIALDCSTLTTCETCAGQHQGFLTCNFCMSSSSCVTSGAGSCDRTDVIDVAYDCPTDPQKGFEYNETFARTRAFQFASAAYSGDPQSCLKATNLSINVTKVAHPKCDNEGNLCHSYIAVLEDEKAVILASRGATQAQAWGAVFDTLEEDFPGGGKVHPYFYNASDILWNESGLGDELLRLKLLHPDFELWVTGHSLGAGLSSLFAQMAVVKGLWPGEKIKLVTFGQMRVGDIDFAAAHDANLPYSYRVIHAHDFIPHIPFKLEDPPFFHHRYEVWYNNSMHVGLPYKFCNRPDDDSCSNQDLDLSNNDHNAYFTYNMYGGACCSNGCPPR